MPGKLASNSKQSYQSALTRQTAPTVPAEDQEALASGNMAFAADLYQVLAQSQENLFYSPYSISLALAMAYAGARGDTEKAMSGVLHFSLPQEQLHPALNAVDQALAERKESGGRGSDGEGFRLNIANDIWGEQTYEFLPAYLDLLAKNYGAGLRAVDFVHDPQGARQAINDTVAQETEQRIQDLVPPDAINPMTRLVLTNAIYFNAAWLHPFDESSTQDAPFTRLDGNAVTVKMMSVWGENFPYTAGSGYQAVALPYENPALSMVLLVPDQGNFEAFEAGLTSDQLRSILQSLHSERVNVQAPRFKIESQFQLKDALDTLGMQVAFDPQLADFSGMDGQRNLFISAVVHKAYVDVNEAGTEAAATTAVIMEAGSAFMESEPIQLTIDRPFILALWDEPTQTILFMGRVLDPTK